MRRHPLFAIVAAGLAAILTLGTAGSVGGPVATTPTGAVPGSAGGPTPSATSATAPAMMSTGSRFAAHFPDTDRDPPDPSTLTGYRWPLAHGRITSPFGPSPFGAVLVDGVRFHDGIDLATFCGDHVVAAHSGTVLAAGRKFDPWMGWIGSLAGHTAHMNADNLWGTLPIVVVIDDGNGYRSIYAHFNLLAVKAGQRVRAGQFLGWEGSTGVATGCHLHYGLFSPRETARFELRPDVAKKTKYPNWEIARIDPLSVLPKRPGDSAGQ